MKKIKKILAGTMVPLLVASMLPSAVMAEGDAGTNPGPHVSCVASEKSVEIGDTFTVTMQTGAMDISSFMASIQYDDELVEYVSVDTETVALTPASATGTALDLKAEKNAEDSYVGVYGEGTSSVSYDANTNLVTVTFKAEKAGTANFVLTEDVDGTDAYKSDSITGTAVEITEPVAMTYTAADGTVTDITESAITAATESKLSFTAGKTAYTDVASYQLAEILTTLGVEETPDCSVKLVAGADGFTVYADAEYFENIYLWKDGEKWRTNLYDTPLATSGWSYVTGVTEITAYNHAYEDHACTNPITTGRNQTEACKAVEPAAITFTTADGQTVDIYDDVITAATPSKLSFKAGKTEYTDVDSYKLSEVLTALGVESAPDCSIKLLAGSDGFTVYVDADYYENIYLWKDGEKWRTNLYDTPLASYGWSYVTGVTEITAYSHAYENHECANPITTGRNQTEACSAVEDGYLSYTAADGTSVVFGEEEITAATASKLSFKAGRTEYTDIDSYQLAEILTALGVESTPNCSVKLLAGSDGFTVYVDADYYENIYLWKDGEKWRTNIYDTPLAENGWSYVTGVTNITAYNHSYENHECVNPITTGKNQTEACADITDGYTGFGPTVDGIAYFVDGERQTTTNVVKIDDIWYNLVDGILTPDTIAKNTDNNTWWRIDYEGKVDFEFTGFATNENGTYYCVNGKVDFSATGIYLDSETERYGYAVNGKLQTGKEDVQKNSAGWWYIGEDGYVDFEKNTVAKNSAGWWAIENGKVNFNRTGFVEREGFDTTWYVVNGKINFSATGLYKDTKTGKWGYAVKGQLQTGKEDVQKNSAGWWYIGEDGYVDFEKNTVAKNNAGWWAIENGKVNFSRTGFATNENGTWYCVGGKVDFAATGVYKDTKTGKWGYTVKGQLQTGKEDVQKNSAGWWYIGEDGYVDFTFNGLASNANGTWYLVNGKVDFSFTGTAYDKNIVKGQVQ